jgi:TPR repeat protein
MLKNFLEAEAGTKDLVDEILHFANSYEIRKGEFECNMYIIEKLDFKDTHDKEYRCYAAGVGVPQSLQIAMDWYRKAAEQGFSHSQYFLGNCYFSGGAQRNIEKAIEWWQKAAENKHIKARIMLMKLEIMNEKAVE